MYPYDEDTIKKLGIVWVCFTLALTLAFVILKLVSVIAWSWLWVLAPIWIPFAIGLFLSAFGIKPPGQ